MVDPAGARESGPAGQGGGPAGQGGGLVILDYGMGNLRSVEKAFEKAGYTARITSDDALIEAAPGLVLPGVGAFPRAMERIRSRGWHRLIAERVEAGVPVLGICLGHQLIFEGSEEFGGDEGLGLVEGRVERLDAEGMKVPHIAWAPVEWRKSDALIEGIDDGTAFYFVHSYAPRPKDPAVELGRAAYGTHFAAAIARDRVYGVQFHPEKSSAAGLRLLANFARLAQERP